MKKNKFAEYKTSLFLLLVQIPKILSVIIAHLICYCTKKLVSTIKSQWLLFVGSPFFRQRFSFYFYFQTRGVLYIEGYTERFYLKGAPFSSS